MNKEQAEHYLKLLSNYRSLPKVSEFLGLMKEIGYQFERQKGSHKIYKHDFLDDMNVSKHGTSDNVSPYNINQLRKKLINFIYKIETLETRQFQYLAQEKITDRKTHAREDAVVLSTENQRLYELALKNPADGVANREYAKFIEINGKDIGYVDQVERLRAVSEHYGQAAKCGDAYAQVRLALIIYDNFSSLEKTQEVAIKESYELSSAAAEKNNLLACQNLIDILEKHFKILGLTKNQALNLQIDSYHKILNQENLAKPDMIVANYNLGILYQNNYGELGLDKENAWLTAAKFYEKAADLGDERAVNHLADLRFQQPLFFDKNKSKSMLAALDLYMKAAISGDPKIYENIEYILIEELKRASEPEKELTRAIDWLQLEAAGENANACNVLGSVLATSWDKLKIPEDQAWGKAEQLFKAAAQTRNAQAYNRLALLFEMKKNLVEAVSCHIQSIELGCDLSYEDLKNFINKFTKDKSQVAQVAIKRATCWCKEQADDGDPRACIIWADIIDKSWENFDLYPDKEEAGDAASLFYITALDSLRLTADKGDVSACIVLADLLISKSSFLKISKECDAVGEALKLYIFAAESGVDHLYKKIKDTIIEALQEGAELIQPPVEIQHAINWLKKQAENKIPAACLEWAVFANTHWEALKLYTKPKVALTALAHSYQVALDNEVKDASGYQGYFYEKNAATLGGKLSDNLDTAIRLYIKDDVAEGDFAYLNLANLVRYQLALNKPTASPYAIKDALNYLESKATKENPKLCQAWCEILVDFGSKLKRGQAAAMIDAEKIYRLSTLKGRGNAFYALAKFLKNKASLPNVNKKTVLEEAVICYIISAQSGVESAYENLGSILNDQLKLAQPEISMSVIRHGLEFFAKQTESEHPTACLLMAYMLDKYSDKLGLDEQDSLRKANALYRTSLKELNVKGCECLALLLENKYEYLEITELDAQREAIEWYVKAASFGSEMANSNLMRMTSSLLASNDFEKLKPELKDVIDYLRGQAHLATVSVRSVFELTTLFQRNVHKLQTIIPRREVFKVIAACWQTITLKTEPDRQEHIKACIGYAQLLEVFSQEFNDDPAKSLTDALGWLEKAKSLGGHKEADLLAAFKLKHPLPKTPVRVQMLLGPQNNPPQPNLQPNLQRPASPSISTLMQPQSQSQSQRKLPANINHL